MLFIAAVAAAGFARLQQAGRWVDHTERVLDRLDALLLHLGDAESEERGYLITGDESRLAPYRTALSRVAADTAAIRALTLDNPQQQARLDSLFPAVTAKVGELEEIVGARRSGGLDSASRIVAGRGARLLDDVRRRVLEAEAEERALLRSRATRLRAETRLALVVVAAGSILAIVLLTVINRALRRDLDEQRRVASLLERQAVELEQKTAELENQLETSQALTEEAELSAQQARDAALEAEKARVLAEESERRFRDTANRAPVMIWTSGPDGMRDWYNAPWLAFRGRTMGEERGMGWAEGVHPDDHARCLDLYDASLEARRPFSMEYRLRRHDGEFRWVLGNGTPRFAADGDFLGFIGSCIDVTAQRRAAESMAFLGEAGRLASSSLELERTLSLLTRHAVPTLADYCSVDMLSESGEIRRVETAHVDPAKEAIVRELWTRFPYRAEDRVGVSEVIRTGRPLLVHEFSDEAVAAFARDPEQLALLHALAPISYVCVPLIARGRAYGAISLVMSDSRRRYTPDDLNLAIELSRRAATAVDNARLYAAEREARQAAEDAALRTDRLQRVTAALAGAVSSEDVATAVVTVGLEALGASAATVGLLTRDGAELELVDSRGYQPPLPPRHRVRRDAGLPLTDAIVRRETIALTSAAERVARYPAARTLPGGDELGAFVGAPLMVGDRVLGAIGLSYAGERRFTDEDLAFVSALAALCAQATERTRLYQTEQRARRRAAFLGDASALLASSLDYETTLQRTADLAVPELSDWCAVDLVEPDGSLRRVAVSHPDREKLALGLELERRFPAPPDHSGTLRVVRTGRSELYPVITDEMLVAGARSPEHLDILRRLGFNSVMIVPLRARGRAVGAMTFVASAPGRHHDDDDLALAEELARRAGIAVDNARLFTDAEVARDAAERASKSKSEFLATMSHEIRTPINAVIGYTQLMEMEITGPITPEQRAQLERVSSSGRHLLALIDDILDLAKVEAGRLVVGRRHAEAARAIEDSLALVRPQAEARHVVLSAEVENARGRRYKGDEQRVQQILVNLLSNAVKFTEPGGRISVGCALADETPPGAVLPGPGPWVAIMVSDTGIGIAPDKLERIFRPFEQGQSGYTRVHSGTGLGLTISRRLARLMDGELTVESTEGVGSCFTLWLPAAQAGTADDAEPRLGAPERSAAPTFE